AVALEKTIYLTLTYISSLFDEDGFPDNWKNVEDFQNIIYRQIEENQCFVLLFLSVVSVCEGAPLPACSSISFIIKAKNEKCNELLKNM
ncbi:interferon beta-like, partial [Clarias magur]